MRYYDKLVFELSGKTRRAVTLPKNTYGVTMSIPSSLSREAAPALPELSQLDVVRHYTLLSQMNIGVDSGFYPLGSCTMKYNPRINEEVASMPSFNACHPLQPSTGVQGILKVYDEMDKALAAITGMKHFTFNPCAGAHGELTGLMIIRQYHMSRGDLARTRIIVPDSAHGTNPASAAVCGLQVVQVKSKPDGRIDLDNLKLLLDDTVAGIMMTNPNTLGLFESQIKEIAEAVHACGGLLYYDGANMNPLLGKVRPGDMGFDVMHLNLHKSFSTPHGGGGPGSGPVGVAEHLVRCLPSPRVVRCVDGTYRVAGVDKDIKAAPGYEDMADITASCGRVSTFMGNFGVMLKAYAYILSLGNEYLPYLGPYASLGANYIKESLKDCYELPVDSVCKHEFVFDGLKDKSTGVTTLEVAKRLLDYGFHAPTIYFPLLFHQSIMIEPTESENKETLDAFIGTMREIAREAEENPQMLHDAPHTTPVRRLDETTAARNPILKYSQQK